MNQGEKPNGATSVVIPNLNGGDDLAKCLESLKDQTLKAHIIVVDNASSDNSVDVTRRFGAELIQNSHNRGFAGGVNPGIKRAIERGDKYVALFNNDAFADKKWLEQLHDNLTENPDVAVVTSKIIGANGRFLDSTGDFYSSWGLPFPRGRGESGIDKYDHHTTVFAASGGASLYRIDSLKQVGLFDEDFFAYYEDVDLSFRLRLAGWSVNYEPKAVAHHKIGATSAKIHGFAAKQTTRNLPFLLIKNVPLGLLPEVVPRFLVLYISLVGKSLVSSNALAVLTGLLQMLILLPKKLWQRYQIQSSSTVSANEISLLIIHDLPPDARRLRKLRAIWWRLLGKRDEHEDSD